MADQVIRVLFLLALLLDELIEVLHVDVVANFGRRTVNIVDGSS